MMSDTTQTPMNSHSELGLWGTEYDTVIAASAADAIKVWEETIGDDYVKSGYGDVDDWKRYADHDIIVLIDEDEPGWDDRPPEASVEPSETHPGCYQVTATAKQWVDHYHERRFFSSTEW